MPYHEAFVSIDVHKCLFCYLCQYCMYSGFWWWLYCIVLCRCL